MTIAQQLFAGAELDEEPDTTQAQADLYALITRLAIPFTRLGWDWYDVSLEVYGVPDDYQLSTDALEQIALAGFSTCYLNHLNKWETHYHPPHPKGWRVSYPHKRKDDDDRIWIERRVPGWPDELNDRCRITG